MNRRAFDATFVGQRRRRGDRPDETHEARDAGWPAAAPIRPALADASLLASVASPSLGAAGIFRRVFCRVCAASNYRYPAQAILRQVLVCLRELSRTRATPTIIQLKSHATSAILTTPS